MATLSTINSRIGYYQGKIEETRIKIKNKEEEYDKLVLFKTKVQYSEMQFTQANTKKIASLEAVKPYIQNNSHAKRYYNRTKNGLAKTGGRIMTIAFGYLLTKIDSELKNIMRKIDSYENSIRYYKGKIKELERDYKEEQERLEKEGE